MGAPAHPHLIADGDRLRLRRTSVTPRDIAIERNGEPAGAVRLRSRSAGTVTLAARTLELGGDRHLVLAEHGHRVAWIEPGRLWRPDRVVTASGRRYELDHGAAPQLTDRGHTMIRIEPRTSSALQELLAEILTAPDDDAATLVALISVFAAKAPDVTRERSLIRHRTVLGALP